MRNLFCLINIAICFLCFDSSAAIVTRVEKIIKSAGKRVLSSNRCGLNVAYPTGAFMDRIYPEDRVLDVGSGTGFFTKRALKAGARVTAVDRDPKAVTYLKKHLSEVKVFKADVLNLPDVGAHDAVFSSFMLPFIAAADIEKALKNMMECMKEGGYLMTALPPMGNTFTNAGYGFLTKADRPFEHATDDIYIPLPEILKREHIRAHNITSPTELEIVDHLYTLSNAEKDRLVEKYGDTARYYLTPQDYIPRKITYIDNCILEKMLLEVGLTDIHTFNIMESGSVVAVGSVARR